MMIGLGIRHTTPLRAGAVEVESEALPARLVSCYGYFFLPLAINNNCQRLCHNIKKSKEEGNSQYEGRKYGAEIRFYGDCVGKSALGQSQLSGSGDKNQCKYEKQMKSF